MKRILLATVLALAVLLASACDQTASAGCTQCGFSPHEQILTSYVDSSGATIPVSGYANENGCFTPYGCS